MFQVTAALGLRDSVAVHHHPSQAASIAPQDRSNRLACRQGLAYGYGLRASLVGDWRCLPDDRGN